MRTIPFSKQELEELRNKYKTPFYVYDELELINRVNKVNEAFAWNKEFTECFAVKANPNTNVLKVLQENGCGFDAASKAEIILAKKAGALSNSIIFTANFPLDEDYLEALQQNVIINLDAYEQIENLCKVVEENNLTFPDRLCFRYNPGKFSIPASFIGELESSKFGMTKAQLFNAIKKTRQLGCKHFGIHAMLAGNALEEDYYPLLAKEIFTIAKAIKDELDADIELIDLAGGIGIPYLNDQKEVDIISVGNEVRKVYEEEFSDKYYKPRILTEMGRYVSGPIGYLVTSVTATKETYRKYIGVDASMADLMRPGMYGSYHEILVLNDSKEKGVVDVVGPICENNDKFAIQRTLPKANKNDLLVILDAGAHARSMGFNYNGRLRAGEFLYNKDTKEFKLIRRKETVDDYFSTII